MQIGLINIAKKVKGVPISFLTLVKNGYKRIELTNSDVFIVNSTFKTGTDRFYNIISIGTISQENTGLWSLGYGLGTRFKFKKTPFSIDIGFNYHLLIDQVNSSN
jgi:hypothetical protein